MVVITIIVVITFILHHLAIHFILFSNEIFEPWDLN